MTTDSEEITCGDYFLYPVALHRPRTGKWEAMVIATRKKHAGDTTQSTSKCLKPTTSATFSDEASAKAYALRYGQMLVAGNFEGLPN